MPYSSRGGGACLIGSLAGNGRSVGNRVLVWALSLCLALLLAELTILVLTRRWVALAVTVVAFTVCTCGDLCQRRPSTVGKPSFQDRRRYSMPSANPPSLRPRPHQYRRPRGLVRRQLTTTAP